MRPITFVAAVLSICALFVYLILSLTDSAQTVSDKVSRPENVSIVILKDGTRCAVLMERNAAGLAGGIHCNWARENGLKRPL